MTPHIIGLWTEQRCLISFGTLIPLKINALYLTTPDAGYHTLSWLNVGDVSSYRDRYMFIHNKCFLAAHLIPVAFIQIQFSWRISGLFLGRG